MFFPGWLGIAPHLIFAVLLADFCLYLSILDIDCDFQGRSLSHGTSQALKRRRCNCVVVLALFHPNPCPMVSPRMPSQGIFDGVIEWCGGGLVLEI